MLWLFIGLVLATIATESNTRADQEVDDHDFIFFLHPAFTEGVTDNNGEFEFSWDAAFNNFDYLALIKASIANHYPNAVWISIFDAQEQKLVFGQEQMVVELPLILHTGDIDRDSDTDGLDLYDLIVDMSQLELSIFAENFGKIHESNSI